MMIKKTAKVLALSSLLILGNEVAFAEEKDLLDTLLQNGTITQSQYDNLVAEEAAETKQEAKQEAAKKNDDVIVKLDSKGFRVETADKAFKFKFGGRIQLDANFSGNRTDFDPRPTEGVEVRRARLYASGVLWSDFQYKAQFDFANNKLEIKDLFVKYTGLDWFNITVGNQKQTISMELQESSNDIMFTERSLVYSLTTPLFDRALGVRLDSSGKSWSTQLGVFGAPIGKSLTEGWGISGRATIAPINTKTHVLHLGASVGYRGLNNPNNGVQFKYETSHMSNTYFSKAAVGDISGTTLAGIDLGYIVGPFSVQSEYAHTWVARDNGMSGLDFGAYYVQAAWTITGESRSYKGAQGKFKRLQPANEFSWQKGTWGAWELATRIDGNDLNSGDIRGGQETALTIALNWYLNRNIRLMADYRYAFAFKESPFVDVDGNSVDNGLHGFTLRTQLAF